MKARLVLEDGSWFEGESFGATGESFGEVVFNTGMAGYQEVLTDPSYCGQIVTMTYPLVGNYGCNMDDIESTKSHVRGFVVREAAKHPSHYRSQDSLDAYLKRENVIGIEGIDTRRLTRILRVHGTMRGVITTQATPLEELVARVNAFDLAHDQVAQVTTKSAYRVPADGDRIVLLDFGTKMGTLRSLRERGCDIVVLPAFSTREEILAWKPKGIMLSNGPGDPEDLLPIVEVIKQLIGQIPMFGICMGHQLLSLACGATTEKLQFGHRGANHPVKDLRSGRVFITSQNHGYVVKEKSLIGTDLQLTHINQNDGTVEGVRHAVHAAFSVQYHPEARPGPDDSDYLFDDFLTMIEAFWEGGKHVAKA
nr:glutamine-hydrolyzing carbamoyl-phosphate synthase small subunit [Bacilli bacterium]